ncbi:potassium-transporting ATPase subunit F [Microcella sp.]
MIDLIAVVLGAGALAYLVVALLKPESFS